jgi:sulfopyruvate decarboxylase subunit alpha
LQSGFEMASSQPKMNLVTIAASDFCDALEKSGFGFFTGVPCSIFKPLYHELGVRPHLTYVPAVREDSAVGIAVGAYMAGLKPVIIMQNSGLGYCLNAFTSLVLIYEIPLLVLMSWRGYQGKDAPEHIVIGATMLDILSDVDIPHIVLGKGNIHEELNRGTEAIEGTNKPVFLIVRKGLLL